MHLQVGGILTSVFYSLLAILKLIAMFICITTINVNGLNSPYKRFWLWREAITQKSDLWCVQEMHFMQDKAPFVLRGVMIAISRSLSIQLHHLEVDPHGRYLILDGLFDNMSYVIANIYASNFHQKQFFKSIMNKLSHYPKEHIILCRDFNDTINNALDSSNQCRQRSTTLSILTQLEDLYDPWRCLHRMERDFTFVL